MKCKISHVKTTISHIKIYIYKAHVVLGDFTCEMIHINYKTTYFTSENMNYT